jgi:hypothetical protein
VSEEEILIDSEVEQPRSCLTERADSLASEILRPVTPKLAIDTGELSDTVKLAYHNTHFGSYRIPKNYKPVSSNSGKTPNKISKASKVKYQTVAKDIVFVQKNSKETSYFCRPYSDILRNQLVRAHSHSLLEIALKFEEYRKRNPHNKDPTWFLEKAASDLFLFSDELQGVSNLPQAARLITATDFEELTHPASVGPFVGFVDPRSVVAKYSKRAYN